MIVAAETGQEDLPLVGDVVAVGVGVLDDVGRAGDEDLAAQDTDAEGRDQVFLLNEDLAAVAGAVTVGVFEDDDAVTLLMESSRVAIAPLAIVHRFGHPDAPARIDIHRRRVVEMRRLGP